MQFSYTVRQRDGAQNQGVIEAKDTHAAARSLRQAGGVVTSLESVDAVGTSGAGKMGMQLFTIPLKEKVLFAVNLSVMVGSGLSIARSLKNLSEQLKSKETKKIVTMLYKDVLQGITLSDAMARQPKMFNGLFVNMVRVGEVGGNLEESLTIVAHQLEKEQALKSRVRGAMMYPAIVMLAMLGVGVLMLTYILPQIMGVFKDMDVVLPASTQFIINMSDGLRDNGLLVSIGSAVFIIAFIAFLRTNAGKVALSHFSVTMPVVKTMTVAVNCARFARIHSSLLRSGVSVIESLTIVRNTLTNTLYKEALNDAINATERGVTLGETIRKYPKIFPIMMPQMIDVGEETGKTGVMLMKLAEFYETQVEEMTKNLSSILEPLLMIIIGSGVGFFAVAMLKPMYSVLENIQ